MHAADDGSKSCQERPLQEKKAFPETCWPRPMYQGVSTETIRQDALHMSADKINDRNCFSFLSSLVYVLLANAYTHTKTHTWTHTHANNVE